MPTITLSTEQVRQAQNEDAARGLLPKVAKKFAHSGELYEVLDDNPVLLTKYSESGEFDPKALRNAMKQAIKNVSEKAQLAGGTFPELSAMVHAENGEVHVLLVNDDVLNEREAEAAASNGDGEIV